MAIVWATLRCSFYLCGLSLFTIYTDHRPLQGVFQKDIFDLASPCLQRLREKIAMYSFQICWVPGKTHFIADALSHAPLFAPEELPGLEIDTAISCLLQTSQPSLQIIYDAIDEDYLQLIEDIKSGTSFSTYHRALKRNHDILSLSDNLVLFDSCRIVLSLRAVKLVLRLLHSSHSSITKTTQLARGLYFWPGMTNAIKQLVSTCEDCTRVLPSQPSNLSEYARAHAERTHSQLHVTCCLLYTSPSPRDRQKSRMPSSA